MPAVLKGLMRHADITTTMNYYVGTESVETARMLYNLVDTSVDSTPSTAQAESA